MECASQYGQDEHYFVELEIGQVEFFSEFPGNMDQT